MVVDTQRLEAAAAGDSEAMIEVILAEGQGVRLFIAAHTNDVTLVSALEQATWSTARRQLPLRDTGVPVAEWLRWVAAEHLDRHLQGVDLLGSDEVSRLVVQQCSASLTARHDHQAADAATKLHGASSEVRDLLKQRYGDGEDLDRLAARRATTVDAIAAALAAARSACDWRGGEAPMGDRLLPRLLEDWFSGTLDPDSRALLMEGVARSPAQAAALVRQVRLHAVLTVLHQPFGLREAMVLARAAAKAGEARDQGSSYRGRGVPRTTGSDARRPSRIASNVRTEAGSPASPSSLPLILVGVVVLIGVLVLVVMTRDGGARPIDAARVEPSSSPSAPLPTTEPQVPTPGGSALRPQFGGGAQPPVSGDGPLVLTWSGAVRSGSAYVGEPLRLVVEATRPDQIGAVDFLAGDRLLATITKAPYTWDWREPTPFTGDLSARAHAKDGAVLTTITAPLRILTVKGNGLILREWWAGSPGRTIAEGIKATTGYPVRPKGATFESEFNARRDWAESYLQRMRGFIIPPQDGAYTFWVVGDDEAELWLSSDESRANLRRIAVCPSTKQAAVSFQKWDDRPQQRSEAVMLKGGQRYYIEALHKENTGNDHLSVGWQLPDGTMERPIPGKHLAPPEEPLAGGGRASLVFATGFEDAPVGGTTPHFNINLDEKVAAATVVVMEGGAAEGQRFLRLNDAPGQKNEWTPEVCRSVDFTGGVMRMAFALRTHPGCRLHYGWRQYSTDRSFINGPRFSFDGSGALVIGARRVPLPQNVWLYFTVTAGLGSQATGTWDLQVQPAGGTAQVFNDLPYDAEFKRLHWVGYSSTLKDTAMVDLDAVTMHLLP